MINWEQIATLVVSAAAGGAINAVAGGGTLLTFPALLWAGQRAIAANATSTVALLPGIFSSFWGYRREVASLRRVVLLLTIPSLLGGIVGAVLLLNTDPNTFDAIVPYLILLATGIFIVQEPLSRWQKRLGQKEVANIEVFHTDESHAETTEKEANEKSFGHSATPTRIVLVVISQLAIGVYGGYFGAGIGILMLAAYAMFGFTNIHQANAVKVINSGSINCIAAVLFIFKGLVDWRLAGIMAIGAIFGGYAGAGIAQRIGQRNVRRLIIAIGLGLAASLLFKQYL